MKKVTLLLGVLFSLATVQAQPPEPPPQPETIFPQPMEPAEVISAFVEAFSVQRDLDAASRLVQGGLTGAALQSVAAELAKEHSGWTFKALRSDVNIKGNTATAKVMLQHQHRLFGKITHQERLTLHRAENKWKIAPISGDEVYRAYRDYSDSDILANIATYLARPQEIQEARAYQCMTNLKQIALGILQFTQDYDEKFVLNDKTFQKLLEPYTRNREIYHCPDDKSGEVSYSFNGRLENASLAQIENPRQTVMLYEGKNGQLDFRHNNRASICFVDGHCELVTPEQAKALRWEP